MRHHDSMPTTSPADHQAARGPAPDSLFPAGGVPAGSPEIAVYLQMLRLKRQFRRGWLRAGVPPELCESVADHAWGCAHLALLLASREGLDPSHCAMLALVHELGEVHAGDITPHDGITAAEKRRREAEAVECLLAPLAASPDAADREVATLLSRLWQEYEDGETPSARFVKRIDRLEMGFQAAVYRAEGYGAMADFLESAAMATAGSSLAGTAASVRDLPATRAACSST
jgi:putative hydrolase of HD superfamily